MKYALVSRRRPTDFRKSGRPDFHFDFAQSSQPWSFRRRRRWNRVMATAVILSQFLMQST